MLKICNQYLKDGRSRVTETEVRRTILKVGHKISYSESKINRIDKPQWRVNPAPQNNKN